MKEQKPNQVRHNQNLSRLHGMWHGTFYENGIPRVPIRVKLRDRWGTLMPSGDLFIEPYPSAKRGESPTQGMQSEVEKQENHKTRKSKWI